MVYCIFPYKPMSREAVQVRFFFSFGPWVPDGSFSTSEIFLLSSVE